MGFSVWDAEEASISELVRAAQADSSNDSTAMAEILRRYDPLVQNVVGSLGSDPNSRDDLANGARWGLVRAVRAHDGRADGFISYMIRFMRGEAHRAVERLTAKELSLSPDMLPYREVALEPAVDTYDLPLAVLSDGQRRILTVRYWEDKTYADIARTEGKSLSAVRQRFGTIHRKLKVHMIGQKAA